MNPYIFTNLGDIDLGIVKKAMAVNMPYDMGNEEKTISDMKERMLSILIEQSGGEKTELVQEAEKNINLMFENFNPLELHSEKEWQSFLDKLGMMNTWPFRAAYTGVFSWSIPSKEVIEEIKDFVGDTPVYEYMSGTGYWAYLMKQAGIETTATDMPVQEDSGEDIKSYLMSKSPNFIEMQTQDVSSANVNPNNVIMMSWIPYQSDIANNVLGQMVPGQKLILIGEGQGGCTATETTFCVLDEYFDLVKHVRPPQFDGINDYISFYVRNSNEFKGIFDPTELFENSSLEWENNYRGLHYWDADKDFGEIYVEYRIEINEKTKEPILSFLIFEVENDNLILKDDSVKPTSVEEAIQLAESYEPPPEAYVSQEKEPENFS